MNLKEIAEMFEMTVSELSDYTGYSRQALYAIMANKNKVNDKRFKAMINQLKLKAQIDRERELKQVERNYNDKLKALDEFENRKSDAAQIIELYKASNN